SPSKRRSSWASALREASDDRSAQRQGLEPKSPSPSGEGFGVGLVRRTARRAPPPRRRNAPQPHRARETPLASPLQRSACRPQIPPPVGGRPFHRRLPLPAGGADRRSRRRHP